MRISESEYLAIQERRSQGKLEPSMPMPVKRAIRQAMPGTEILLMLDIPLKTVSEINYRDSWQARMKRRKAQQREVNLEWKRAMGTKRIRLPCRVVLTRVGAKELDDDNLRSAFKNVRDEVAILLGVDDSPSSPAQFDYRQEATGKHEYSIKIEVESV